MREEIAKVIREAGVLATASAIGGSTQAEREAIGLRSAQFIMSLFADKVRWLEVDINPYGEAIHFGVKVGLAAFRNKLLKELGVEA